MAHERSSFAEDGPFAAAMSRSRRSISRLIVIEIHVVDGAGAGGGLGGGLAPGADAGSEQRLVGPQGHAEVVLLAGQPQHVVGGIEQGAVGPVVDLVAVVALQFVAGEAEDGGGAVEGEAVEHGQDDDAAGVDGGRRAGRVRHLAGR